MPPVPDKKVKWNAADYAANSIVQQSWARELIAKLNLRGDERILDIGCGDGKVTAEMAKAVPRGFVAGTDASAEMIEFAQKSFPKKKYPNLQFQICDARKISKSIFPRASLDSLRQSQARNCVARPCPYMYRAVSEGWPEKISPSRPAWLLAVSQATALRMLAEYFPL